MKITKLVTVFVLAIVVMVSGRVVAQEADSRTRQLQQQTSPAARPTQQNQQTQQNDNVERLRRIQERRESAPRQITADEQAIVRTRCSTVQSKISSTGVTVRSLEARSGQVYERLLQRLEALRPVMADHDLDMGQYEQSLSELGAMVEQYRESINGLSVAIGDTENMSCDLDPAGFAITVLAAREQRAAVVEASRNINRHVREKIRPELEQIKHSLQKPKSSSEDQL